ncbi:SixA phosphatase family protein [Ascidiimonas sp. W6]|uniref:SixA phosphatase family protein n=1 Tax=Ascidiimonas meishanensis TaxID=3128903 RepID=UPI0030EE6D8C
MKTLTLIRHAKSSWDYQVVDKDRPLNQRGIDDAHLVSSHLANKPFLADAVFSSYANRAMHTCAIFMRNLNIHFSTLEISPKLYDFSGESVHTFIKNLNDNYEKVIIFGHNHAFTHLTNILGDKFIDNLPTSGLVTISFPVNSWREISQGSTINMIFPKQFK